MDHHWKLMQPIAWISPIISPFSLPQVSCTWFCCSNKIFVAFLIMKKGRCIRFDCWLLWFRLLRSLKLCRDFFSFFNSFFFYLIA